MTIQEMVDQYGEVRIAKITRPFMRKSIGANNEVVETPEVMVSYEVAVRNHASVEEATLEAALLRVE
jgi:hypothetical protein